MNCFILLIVLDLIICKEVIFGDGEWGGWSIRDRKCGSYRVFMSDEF